MPKCECDLRIKLVGDGCSICNPQLTIDLLSERLDEAEDKLSKIAQWCEAYPVDLFPEPDFKKAATVLKENGMTIDSISASNFRHVLRGVRSILEA